MTNYVDPWYLLVVIHVLLAVYVVQAITGDRSEDQRSTVPPWRYENPGRRTPRS